MKITPLSPLSGSRAGFSLIELVVVMVLIAIMVGLAAPRMTNWMNRTRVEDVVRQLATDISFARMTAVRSGERVTITFATGEYRLQRADQTAPFKRVRYAAEHPQLNLSSTQTSLVFDSRGLMTTGSADITAQKASQSLRLNVTATGRVNRVY